MNNASRFSPDCIRLQICSRQVEQADMNVVYRKRATEKVLWHQHLGHPCDEYLFNAHK